ncbi:sensor histidine kinase [Melittangium boletus]|uniref:sensor histidine kinase n=1 Tax=Melittangium boletus TaxID=83453 RepID=UPI003DA68008
MEQHRRFLLAPFIVLVLVVGCFGASVAYVEHVRRELAETALSYGRVTGPLLSPLTDMRLQVHRIVSLGRSEPGLHSRAQRMEIVREALREFNASYQRYLAMARGLQGAPFGGELSVAIDRLDATCAQVMAHLEVDEAEEEAPRPPSLEQQRLIDASESVTRLLMKEMAVGARDSNLSLAALEAANTQAQRLGRTLYGVCGLTALVGGLLAAYVVRKHLRLSELYTRLQAERARELEQFAGRVAHDILGPLQPVSLGLELLGRKRAGDAEVMGLLARSQRGLARVRLIVEGLLRFARAGAQPEPGQSVFLPGVVDGLREDLGPPAELAGVGLKIDPLPEVKVACSEAALVVVLQNLIRNAVKYIGEGPLKQVEARATVEARTVHLVVRDSGPGLPPGMERSIFEPYVRATRGSQPGIGLGLATVKRIVEAHGGQVGVHSTPGAGCAFWVELPLAV